MELELPGDTETVLGVENPTHFDGVRWRWGSSASGNL